jgi:hypothetical protein
MWAAIIAGAVSLIGSYMSKQSANSATAAANSSAAQSRQLYIDAAEQLGSLTPPNLSSLLEPLQRKVSLGEITPEQYIAEVQEQTALAGVKIPQEILDAQYGSLAAMRQIADEGGLTAIDRAKLENIKSEVATQEQGKREAIAQDAARRGISGSGLEEMSRIANQQGAATRDSQLGFDVAANAEKRALEAITQSGKMAGDIRTQEYNQQAEEAKARDMINKFNTTAAQTASDKNVASANAAQAANLAKQYELQGFNIEQQAKEAANRQAAAQADWENLFGQKKAIANAMTGNASAVGADASNLTKLAAAQNAAAAQGVGNAVGSGITAYTEYQKQQELAQKAKDKEYDDAANQNNSSVMSGLLG